MVQPRSVPSASATNHSGDADLSELFAASGCCERRLCGSSSNLSVAFCSHACHSGNRRTTTTGRPPQSKNCTCPGSISAIWNTVDSALLLTLSAGSLIVRNMTQRLTNSAIINMSFISTRSTSKRGLGDESVL